MDTDIIVQEKPGRDVLPIDPQDIKYWECVQRVRREFSNGCNTTRKACEMAGVSHDFYYTSLKSPYVQTMFAIEIEAMERATHEIIHRSWVPILINMARIAKSESSKEAVQAARLVQEVRKELKEASKDIEQGRAVHPAKLLRDSYLKPRKLTRTTTVEEVELEE